MQLISDLTCLHLSSVYVPCGHFDSSFVVRFTEPHFRNASQVQSGVELSVTRTCEMAQHGVTSTGAAQASGGALGSDGGAPGVPVVAPVQSKAARLPTVAQAATLDTLASVLDFCKTPGDAADVSTLRGALVTKLGAAPDTDVDDLGDLP